MNLKLSCVHAVHALRGKRARRGERLAAGFTRLSTWPQAFLSANKEKKNKGNKGRSSDTLCENEMSAGRITSGGGIPNAGGGEREATGMRTWRGACNPYVGTLGLDNASAPRPSQEEERRETRPPQAHAFSRLLPAGSVLRFPATQTARSASYASPHRLALQTPDAALPKQLPPT